MQSNTGALDMWLAENAISRKRSKTYIKKDTETGQVQSPDWAGEVSEVGLGLTYGKHKDTP